ncbi:tyrosine-type recombinase/integrase [Vibrio tubiashii]|uniref:Integrase n=1 Tax=Vibrio tubiashii ATCC 19109 TaxID=1051646 RepID=F9T2I2_9VIBR|nr:tyrosine-type recombinase/integrase [Vibrio tubiashii]AIW16483.1 integrase [Vibrio tubiashii ATCC 19109]EGU57722.1 phage family integrase [Vibrio tubiashii ATCC 19109]EIF04868.1 phage family integrase [Vibrio tubiashii NCIMB 1337 = ATCC 19106]
MPKLTVRLSDKEIKKAEVRDKEYILADGNGLNIRIRPNGTKSWQFRYSAPVTKKVKKLSLGSYPALKLADARKVAQEHRNLIANGVDPKDHLEQLKQKAIHQEANTFFAVAEQWFSRKKKTVSANHAERIWRTLELYAFPHIGRTPIASITRLSAVQALRPLENDQKLSTIKRICQSLNQIMEYGVDSGIIIANPLTRMINAFEKHEVEHMPTIRPELLNRLLKQLRDNANIRHKTKLLILWQLHTMTRPKEAARARWNDIDLNQKCWTIPPAEMKRRKEHRVPLTEAAIEILSQMRLQSEGHEYVFPSERAPKSHVSVYTANAALKRSLGFKGELVAHGLRSIASTALHEEGFDTLHIEACLSHTDQNETRASYNRTDFFEQRKEIMEWWSDYIQEAKSRYCEQP